MDAFSWVHDRAHPPPIYQKERLKSCTVCSSSQAWAGPRTCCQPRRHHGCCRWRRWQSFNTLLLVLSLHLGRPYGVRPQQLRRSAKLWRRRCGRLVERVPGVLLLHVNVCCMQPRVVKMASMLMAADIAGQ